MLKKSLILLILMSTVSYSKINVGFYSLTQTAGDFQNIWIGYALTDIISDKLSSIPELNLIKDDQIFDFLNSKGMNTSINTASINSFNGEIKENFNLDYIVTGNFRVNPDNSLPVNIVVYSLKDTLGLENPPIIIQGFANDLYTIVSYITQPICTIIGLNLTFDQISAIKQIDLTSRRSGTANIYKGKISFRNKDYKSAADSFEEAYKEDPINSSAKEYYDKSLAYFYGEGVFAFNLLETDNANNTPFRKQYMITRRISKSYTSELVSTNLSPRNDGSHFDIRLEVKLSLAPDVYAMTSELIKKFSTGGANTLEEGVYNPNLIQVVDEREMFENNVGNFIINVRFMDKDGNILHHTSQTFKTSFNLTFSGAVKNVFKNDYVETSVLLPSVARDIVKNTTKIVISVE